MGPLALHDVRDVEAHVRALLDARLREWGARLRPNEYDDALTYLIEKCWELSGVDAAGNPRIAWWARVVDVEALEDDAQLVGPYRSEQHAIDETAGLGHECVELVEGRPTGAYDPNHGIAFSTYSRRILSLRVVDWYRATLGDARYGSQHRSVSLEGLASRYERDGEAPEQFLDHVKGSDVDETEEVLFRAALGR